MTGNALIAAIGKAVAHTKENCTNVDTEAEILSNYLVQELSALPEPDDPNKGLKRPEIWLRAAVADLTLDQRRIEQLKTFYKILTSEPAPAPDSEPASPRAVHERLKGAIGFLLCCRSADHAQSLKAGRYASAPSNIAEEVAAARTESNEYLADPAVRKWISSYYAIGGTEIEDKDATAEMIASGTTSYVIRYTGSADFVLKLVKPQFTTSSVIGEQTAKYGKILRANKAESPRLPSVFAYDNSYIRMEYIKGKNLADFMAEGRLDTMKIAERRELLYGIIGNLEELRAPHLDLSPGNIMVEENPIGADGNRRFNVRLIDFGYNYLLREGLSGIPVRNDIVRYSAPEMMAGSVQASIKADLYSLGIIILEIMRSSPSAVDLSVQLDRCWQSKPGLAAIVEELIADDPADRAPWSDELDQSNTYGTLRRRLKQEEQITRLIDTRLSMSDAWSALDGPLRELMRVIREVPALWQLKGEGELTPDARYLYVWSGVINLLLVASLAACGYMLIFETIDLSSFAPADKLSISAWTNSAGLLFEKLRTLLTGPPQGQQVLAGQALALTIILVVSQYYNSIFSSITTRSIRGRAAQRAEFTMRFTPLGIMALCVSTAIWFPTWWYFTSLIGPMVTAANNHCVLRFCKDVREHSGRRKIVGNLETTDVARFDETFARWPKGMIYTGILIFAVGVLLRFDIIHDEAFIGLAMAFLCYSALYQSASTDMSALVRGGIRRYVKVAERAQASEQALPGAAVR